MSDFESMVQSEVERRLNDPVFLQQKVSALLLRLQEVQPKIESHDALMGSETTMSITNAAKHFDLKPHKHVIAYLREHRLLTTRDMPSCDAIDLDILVLKEAHIKYNDKIRKQAMVEVRQLERWRTYLVPRIIKWAEDEGL